MSAVSLAGHRSLGGSAAAAQPSTLAVQQADAAATFGPRLGELGRVRAGIADDYDKYERACRGKVTTGWATGVAVMPPDVAISMTQRLEIANESTPTCRMLVAGIKSQSAHLTRELWSIDEDARRRGIYPGVMRDLKRSYRFE